MTDTPGIRYYWHPTWGLLQVPTPTRSQHLMYTSSGWQRITEDEYKAMKKQANATPDPAA